MYRGEGRQGSKWHPDEFNTHTIQNIDRPQQKLVPRDEDINREISGISEAAASQTNLDALNILNTQKDFLIILIEFTQQI